MRNNKVTIPCVPVLSTAVALLLTGIRAAGLKYHRRFPTSTSTSPSSSMDKIWPCLSNAYKSVTSHLNQHASDISRVWMDVNDSKSLEEKIVTRSLDGGEGEGGVNRNKPTILLSTQFIRMA